jgi:hypothetical protein
MSLIINPEFEKTQTTYRASTEDVLYQLQEIKTAVSGGGGDTATATNQEEQIVLETALNSLVSTSAKQDTLNGLITSLNSLVATSVKQIEQINWLTTIYNLQYKQYVVQKNTNLFFEYGDNFNMVSGLKNKTMSKSIDDGEMRFSKLTVLIFGTGSGSMDIKAQFNTNSTAEIIDIHMIDEDTNTKISNPINLSQRKLITINNHVAADFIKFIPIGTPNGEVFCRASGNVNNI